MKNTLAIDASTKSTGIAVFDDNKLIHYECISENDGNKLTRIDKMVKKIIPIIKKYKPESIVMQEVLPQDVKHNQAVYKALIYLQAAIVLQNYRCGGPDINFVVSSHWRKVCGIRTGRGVRRQTLKKASQDLVKQLYKIQVNDDVSDAILIGVAYIIQNRSAF